MINKKDIAFLIKQYLETKSDQEELKLLIQVIEGNQYEGKLEAILLEYWLNAPSFKFKLANKELDQMLDSIHHQINLEETNSLKVRKSFLWYATRFAAILFIPLLITSIWMFNNNRDSNLVYNMITLETPMGSKLKTVLPDGTEVWQNSGSTLKYPAKFTNQNREVLLTGEAYFHVSSDKSHPFLVKTADGTVKVTGTRFDVSAYPDDNFSSVVLEEGHVSFIPERKCNAEIELEPNEKIVFQQGSGAIEKTQTEVEKYTAWTEGKLIFRNDPLSVIITRLRRWYNADISLIDPNGSLGNHPFTMTIQNETLPQILKFISEAADLKFEVTEFNHGGSSMVKTKFVISKRL